MLLITEKSITDLILIPFKCGERSLPLRVTFFFSKRQQLLTSPWMHLSGFNMRLNMGFYLSNSDLASFQPHVRFFPVPIIPIRNKQAMLSTGSNMGFICNQEHATPNGISRFQFRPAPGTCIFKFHTDQMKKNKQAMLQLYYKNLHMSHVTRNPVFGVYDQVILKPACSATETS